MNRIKRIRMIIIIIIIQSKILTMLTLLRIILIWRSCYNWVIQLNAVDYLYYKWQYNVWYMNIIDYHILIEYYHYHVYLDNWDNYNNWIGVNHVNHKIYNNIIGN